MLEGNGLGASIRGDFSAVPRVFPSLPPLDSLVCVGELGEEPGQHMTLRFRVKPTHCDTETHRNTHTHAHTHGNSLQCDNTEQLGGQTWAFQKYDKQTAKSTNEAENGRAAFFSRRPATPTALLFTAGFLSAGFLAASDTFLAVKGTPYLQAGLVIF